MIDFKKKGGGGRASVALDNLAGVQINTSLISDTDEEDNLGSPSKYWYLAYINWVVVKGGVMVADDPAADNSDGTLYIGKIGGAWRDISYDNANDVFSFGMNTKITGNFYPTTDSTYTAGLPTKYWKEGYFDKLYLNSTATFDGAVAGHIQFVGDLVPKTDDTEWIGEIGSPFKAVKGVIIKDTTDGKHYKVEVINGTVTATALD